MNYYLPSARTTSMELAEQEFLCPRCGYEAQLIPRTHYCVPMIPELLHYNQNIALRYSFLTDQQIAHIQRSRLRQAQFYSAQPSPANTVVLPSAGSAFRPYVRSPSNSLYPPWNIFPLPKPIHRPIPTYGNVPDLNMTQPIPDPALVQQQANINNSMRGRNAFHLI